MSKNNSIPIFPQSKQNLQLEGMPYMGKLFRKPGGVTQQNHMPRKMFRLKKIKEIMNPMPIILGTYIEPKNM